jgi:hypothetical protein
MSSELTADTLKADAKAGASDPSVLQVGLLFQEALDGKLYAALDRSKICSALGVSARQVPPPHWHKKAWEQLGDVKLDDADRLQQLIDKKHNLRSCAATAMGNKQSGSVSGLSLWTTGFSILWQLIWSSTSGCYLARSAS